MVRQATGAISDIAYTQCFIAYMHIFITHFVFLHFIKQSFQQIIVVICSFFLLQFLECRCTI